MAAGLIRTGRGRLSWRLATWAIAATSCIPAALLAPPRLAAADLSWDPARSGSGGVGGSGTWNSTTANWFDGSADVVWAANRIARFAGTAGTVTAAEPLTARGLRFDTAGYTISGADLTIGAGGIDAANLASGVTTLATGLTLTGGQAWAVGAGSQLDLVGPITRSGGATVALAGSGLVTATQLADNATGIVGSWLTTGSGSAAAYVSAVGGLLGPYAGAVPATGASFIPSGGTAPGINYDLNLAGATVTMGLNRTVSTVRFTAGGILNQNSSAQLAATGILNATDASRLELRVFVVPQADAGEVVINAGSAGFLLTKAPNRVGTYTITGTSTVEYNGANSATATGASTLNVAGGTVRLSNAVNFNSFSEFKLNGAGAQLVHTSSVAGTVPIAITTGTLDGTGVVGPVTVANGTGGAVSNGAGSDAVFTVGSLAFAGAGTLDLRKSADPLAPALDVVGLLSTTPTAGRVTLNLASGPGWTNGSTYNLVGYGSLDQPGADGFVLGTVAGLSSRQAAVLGSTGATDGFITLTVTGDSPVWTGAANALWNTTQTGNWKLLTGGTATVFMDGDQVVFNDSASGSTAIDINAANVAVNGITFDNSALGYTISSSGGYSIGDGSGTASLVKNGSNSLTLNTANTFSGGAVLNAGTLNLGNASAVGSGSWTLAGGTLDNTSGSALVYATAVPQSWTGDFTFAGSADLAVGTPGDTGLGQVTLGGGGDTRTITVANGTFTVGALAGTTGGSGGTGYGLTKAGPGTLVLNPAAASRIGGILTLAGGTLAIGRQDLATGGLAGSGTIVNGSDVTRWLYANVADGRTDTFSGTLADNDGGGQLGLLGLAKQGPGTLVLSGTNSYSSRTSLQGGTLIVAAPQALGLTETVAMSTGTTLVFQTDGSQAAVPFTAGSGTTVNIVSDRDSAGAGVSHTMIGGGVGNALVNITAGSAVTSGTAGLRFDRIDMSAGSVGTLTLNPTDVVVSVGDVTKLNNLSQALGLGGSTTGNIVTGGIGDGAAVAPNAVSVSKIGSGTWTLAADNFYTGATTVTEGTLRVGEGGFVGSLGTGPVVTNARLVLDRADGPFLANVISGSGTFVQDSLGELTLTGDSPAFTGTLEVNGGGLNVGGFGGSGSLGSATLQANAPVQFTRFDDVTHAGPLAGSATVTQAGTGTLTLSGASPAYTGTLAVTSGSLSLTGSLPQATVVVQSGMRLGGTGSVGTVTVANGGSIGNGAGGIAPLTIGGLSFAGAATADLAIAAGGPGIDVTGTLVTTPAAGTVTINASSPQWLNGINELIGFGSFAGNLSNFTVGTITGLSNRQASATLVLRSDSLALDVAGDSLVWGGQSGGIWSTAATGAPVVNPNWALATSHAPANFWEGDVVSFADTVTIGSATAPPATTTVRIQGGDVRPTAMAFSNAALGYTITSSDDSGIAAGSLAKDGAGGLTIATSNSFAGGTTVTAGTVTATATRAFGAGDLTIVGGVVAANATAVVDPATTVRLTGGRLDALADGALGSAAVAISGGTLSAGGTASTDASRISLTGGRLDLVTATALAAGAGPLLIEGGEIGSSGGASLTLAAPVSQTWGGSFSTFGESIAFGAAATVADSATVTLGGSTLSVTDLVNNDQNLILAGSGTLAVAASAVRIGTAAVASMTVNGPSFTTAGTLQVGGATAGGTGGAGTLTVNAGTVSVGGILQIARGVNNQNTNNGTLVVTGGSVSSGDDLQVGYAGLNNLATLRITGGTVSVGTRGQRALAVHQYDTTSGLVEISAGDLRVLNNSFIRMHNGNGSATATINQTGGAVTFYADGGNTVGGSGNLDLQRQSSGANVSVYNLSGGTLTVPSIISSNTNGRRTFNFDGGTLRAATATTNLMNLGGGDAFAYVRNGGAVIDTNSFTVTLAQPLLHDPTLGATADGGLTKQGNGTLILSAASSFTGDTTVAAGTLALTGSLTSNLSVTAGATLSGSGSTTGSATFAAGSLLAADTSAVLTANGVNFVGQTLLQLSGTLFSGATYDVIGYGTGGLSGLANLVATSRGTIADDASRAKVTFTAGAIGSGIWGGGDGTWAVAGATPPWIGLPAGQFFDGDSVEFATGVGAATITVSGSVAPAAMTMSADSDYSFGGSGSIGGSGGLAKTGLGTLALATANTFSGGVVIEGGTLAINAPNALGTGGLVINGGDLANTSGSRVTFTANNPQTWNADLAFAGPSDLVLGSGDVTLTGGDREVTVSAGTLSVGRITNAVGGLTKSGSGSLVLAPVGGASSVAGTLTVAGGTLAIGSQDFLATALAGTGTIANGSGTNRWLIVNDGGLDYTFAGTLTDGGAAGLLGFSKQGTGTATLSGASSYSDTTTLGGGTLVVAHPQALGNTARVNMASTTTLQLATDGGDNTTRIGFGSGSTINLVSDRATPGAGIDHPMAMLAGAGVGHGTVNVTAGSNVTSGTASLSFDVLRLGAGSVGTTRLNPTSAIVTIGDINKSNNNVSQTIGLGGTTTGNTVTGVISNGPPLTGANAVSLSKSGTSTWTLSGTSTYTGSTAITGGTLVVNGGLIGTSGVTVSVDAALGEAGTLAGGGSVTTLVVETGGTLSPGDGIGTLTTTGDATWASGGNLNWQLVDATGTAGSGWDLFSSGGGLNITATSADPFKINLWTLSPGSPATNGPATNFNASAAATWKIASSALGITGFAADAFQVVTAAANGTAGFANAFGTGSFAVEPSLSGLDLNLVYTPGSGPTDIVIDVPSGTQTQSQAGYPTIPAAISVTKTGSGTLVFDAGNAYTGPTTVSAGTLQVAAAGALAGSNVTIDTGATLAVAPGTTMRTPTVIVDGGTLSAAALAVNNSTGITSLAINAGTIAAAPVVTIAAGGQMSLVQDARVSVGVGGLAVDQSGGGGRLDLGAGQVTVTAGGITAADLRADIVAGRNNGGWNGTTGIMSSAAAAAGGTRAVGYIVAGDGSARVSYAAAGDVDLSGAVNVFDLVSVNSAGKYGTGGAAVWNQGDFNYDGVTNVFDLVGINTAAVYGQGNYFPAAPSSAAVGGGVAAVPEPSLAGLAAIGGLLVRLAAVRRPGARGSRRT